MLYGLYLSAAGMLTQQHQVDVIANNMANASTTGFKRDMAIFCERVPESQAGTGGLRYRHPVLDGVGGGTFVCPTSTEFVQGEVQKTNRALDICIKGSGFLAVQDNAGVTSYTRDGRLTVNQAGMLATMDSESLVLDGTGRPIQLDPDRETVIKADGTVSQGGQMVAQLQLTDFEDPHVLRKIGRGLYANPTGAAGQVRRADLISGALERSTVDPMKELVSMIEAQRAYEANAQLIRIQDRTLGKVINDLPKDV